MTEQPAGTVTLVFTDIEGSTRLLQELGQNAYRAALAGHRSVVRESFARHDGYEVDFEGDSFFYAFASAQAAVSAAAEATRGLEGGSIRIRVGIHTGEPGLDPPKYVGLDVHRASRIMAAGHGGQVVLSQSTRDLLEESFPVLDLGEHRLKDLSGPQRLYQLQADGLPDEFPPLKTLYRTNLPVPATPFLGREREVSEVSELLRDGVRLLTLTGPGGTGKTRLGLQAAAEVSDSFPDGIWWVGLASLRDPALLLPELAETLGIREEPGRDLADTLASVLAGKRMLLLLDNAEHLLPDVAGGITRLRDADGPKVVVTSRERLQLAGEHVYPVPPLTEEEGAELFVARAAALGAEHEPTATVGELCARLDNLPLAIELAAARTGGLSVDQILERLSGRLDTLKGARDANPRQQTLRSTIEWSYDLLSPPERELFARLAVFTGGCTLDAAEQVCGAELDTLLSLVDKSLFRRSGERYSMLETIREYAAEQLGRSDELRRRHAAFYERLAADAEDGLRTAAQVAWLERLDAEWSNLRSAIEWSLEQGEPERALRTASSLYSFWGAPSPGEGRAWLRRSLDSRAGTPGERAKASLVLGAVTFFAGDLREAIESLRTGVELARSAGDTQTLVLSLGFSSWVLGELGEPDEALPLANECLELIEGVSGSARAEALTAVSGAWDFAKTQTLLTEALALWRSAGDELGVADALNNLGWSAVMREDYGIAREYLEESLATARRLNDGFRVTLALGNLGLVAVFEGRSEEAVAMLTEDLRLCNARGDRRIAFEAILGLASAHAALGNAALAVKLYAAHQALMAASGSVYFPGLIERLEPGILRARAELDPETVAALTEQGRGITPEAVLAELARNQPG